MKGQELQLEQENTTAPDVYKHNCLMYVGKKWKDWKDELKRTTYNLYDNDEDRLANCLNRVDPDQWRVLVQFWGTKIAKRRSKTNRKSRHEQKMGHKSGRKGHCRVRDELTQIKDGVVVEPDRIQVFIKTHTKKDGQPVDEASALAMRRLNEGASQIPESSESPALREELFTNVLKLDRNGRVRTYAWVLVRVKCLGPDIPDLRSSVLRISCVRSWVQSCDKRC